MIIKGGPRAAGKELGLHLLRADTNEKVEVIDFQGVVARDVRAALREMEAIASGSRSTKPLYHVSVSPAISERLTLEQWQEAADALGASLDLAGHQRFVVLHVKRGRQHAHMVWNRAHSDTLKVAHHSHNYRTHEEVARDLERRFGLERTPGVHAEKEKGKSAKGREKRPNTRDSQQEARTGWHKADAKAAILDAWTRSDNGRAFSARLKELGYTLARGDTRDVVIVDPKGGIHSVRSGVKGLRVAALRTKLGDLKFAELPTIAEARDRLAAPIERTLMTGPDTPKPAAAKKPPHQPARPPKLIAPAYVPTPPTWARGPQSVPALPKQAAPTAPRPVQAVIPAPSRPAPVTVAKPHAQVTAMEARHTESARKEQTALAARHAAERAEFAAWHDQRLLTLAAESDEEIGRLNSFLARAVGVVKQDEWRRQLAYAVAKRQRGMEEERIRQAQKMEEVARAQRLEKEAADAKRADREALDRKALEKRLASQSVQGDRSRQRGLEPD